MRSLVILLDTVRRDFLSCYGNQWVETPNIDRLAGRSVVYDNHYVGSLPCMPARHDMMSGRLNFFHQGWGGLEPYDTPITKVLRNNGVFSHMATDHYHYFHMGGENYVDTFDTWDFQRGQESDKWISLVDKPALPELEQPSKLNIQNWVNRSGQRREEDFSGPRTVLGAVDWLERNARQDDWFLQLELFDPHEPFYVPEEYLRLYGVEDGAGPVWDWPAYEECRESPELVDVMRKRYAALLTMTDRWIGRVLDQLERQGVYDDTLIILTTDHGTHLGDHGYWMKNYMPVRNCLAHIPLIVKLPDGEGEGERCSALTQTPDLFRTLCVHHQAEPPAASQGIGFQEAWRGERAHAAIAFGYHGQAANVTDGRYTYFRNSVDPDAACYHYCSQPTRRLFSDHALHAEVEHGFRFRFSGDLPLMRVPVRLSQRYHYDEAGGQGRHLLHDLDVDREQLAPIDDAAIERQMLEHLVAIMDQVEAPEEQYLRLGL